MEIAKFLVRRYLKFDKTQPFIAMSALLAFLGVAIGLMVLIVAMAIMNGFDKEFQKKLFTMNYPLTIVSHYGISQEEVDGLKNKFPNLIFSPYISSQIMVRRGQKLEGGIIFGVNFEDEKKINPIIAQGLGDIKMSNFDIMLGSGIAESFLLANDEKITLIFTKTEPGGFSILPKMKRFTYKTSFTSGLIAYDKAYLYTNVESLRKVLGYGEDFYDGVHIFSNRPFEDIVLLKENIPRNSSIVGWWQQNGNFFSALALEKRALFIVLMLIILIASLNVISSLLMTVMNRRQEIALLLSLGVKRKEIKETFFILGFTIGGSGILFGVILGFLGIWLLGSFDIISLPADVYGTSKLPMDLSFIDFFSILFGSIVIVALSSYYPALKATKIDILQTLRNE